MINADTEKFAVLGYPVRHSRSPFLFNKLFRKDGINAVYLFLEQINTREAIRAACCLNFRGISVTLPHKIEAMQCVDAVDPAAQAMGCINTLHLKDGKLHGYNFDGRGALEALTAEDPKWHRRRVLIIGNGGAAQGIASSMALDFGIKKIDFLVRNPARCEKLTSQLARLGVISKVHVPVSYNSIINAEIALVINTTPVGMDPDTDRSPFSQKYLDRNKWIYDIVYRPRKRNSSEKRKSQVPVSLTESKCLSGKLHCNMHCGPG